MIVEIPGRIRRSLALVRESLLRKLTNPTRSRHTLEGYSTAYKKRLVDPAMNWPHKEGGFAQKGLVLVSPWLGMPVPYFSMEIGRALASFGCKIIFIKDMKNVFFVEPRPRELKAIGEALDVLARTHDVLELPKAGVESCVGDEKELREIVAENAVRFGGGESTVVGMKFSWEINKARVENHFLRIRRLLHQERPDFLLIPGGVFGASALYALACRREGVHFMTYDCGPGEVVFAHNSAAAHLEDVGRAFHTLRSGLSSEEVASMMQKVKKILGIRKAGTDVYRLQPSSVGSGRKPSYDIFVPLNFRTDTAALQRQKLFTSVQDWLYQLLEWVSLQSDVSIVIRQHPCERIPEFRGTDDWPEFLKFFRRGLGSRLRFVSAWDHVNSYDLIASAKVALPYTSRTGIECAFFGLPTILCSRCFYADAEFVESPKTIAAYFEAIREALSGRTRVCPSQRANAAIFYSLVEKCALCPTKFTPTPDDFHRWVSMKPAELLAAHSVDLILECLLRRDLFPSLLYRRQALHSLDPKNQTNKLF